MERAPDAQVTVACGVLPAPLFAPAPGVVRVIPITKKALSAHWLGLWSQVAGTRWDLVVDLRGSALAWLLATCARKVWRPDRATGCKVEALGRLLDLDPPPAPKLWTTQAHDDTAARLIPDGGPVLGLGPSANWGPKTWPAERFTALLDRLTGADGILPGARVAVFGGPGERDIIAPVLAAIPEARRIDLVGTLDLVTVTAALRRCAFFVGNDSGLMHMAAATGIPTLGLFGPSLPALYAPWGPHCAVAATEIPHEELLGAPGFDVATKQNLMLSLSVDAAEAAARGLHERINKGLTATP
jgi:ADP-heptose:LPS heptosyltransferase